MVSLIELVEHPNDPIADLIDAAGFDEDQRDTGTSGDCGTFALALHGVLNARGLHTQFVFLSPKDTHGDVRLDSQGVPLWSHVMLAQGNKFYDIDGQVELAHSMSNYCWNFPHGATALRVDLAETVGIIKHTRNAWSPRLYQEWRTQLTGS